MRNRKFEVSQYQGYQYINMGINFYSWECEGLNIHVSNFFGSKDSTFVNVKVPNGSSNLVHLQMLKVSNGGSKDSTFVNVNVSNGSHLQCQTGQKQPIFHCTNT